MCQKMKINVTQKGAGKLRINFDGGTRTFDGKMLNGWIVIMTMHLDSLQSLLLDYRKAGLSQLSSITIARNSTPILSVIAQTIPGINVQLAYALQAPLMPYSLWLIYLDITLIVAGRKTILTIEIPDLIDDAPRMPRVPFLAIFIKPRWYMT